MLIGLEHAHAFCVSIFGGVEHLRNFKVTLLGGGRGVYPERCPGADYAKSIKSMSYLKVGQSSLCFLARVSHRHALPSSYRIPRDDVSWEDH